MISSVTGVKSMKMNQSVEKRSDSLIKKAKLGSSTSKM